MGLQEKANRPGWPAGTPHLTPPRVRPGPAGSSLAPLSSFPLPAPVGATCAWVGGRVQNATRGGKARRGRRSPRPNPPLGLGRSPAATTFQAFSLYPPAKIINQRPHRTGTRLTHRPTSTAPQPGLEGGEWRASAGSAPHPRSRPSPPPGHVRHFSVIRLPGPGVGDQTETNAPRRAGRAAGRGRAGRDASPVTHAGRIQIPGTRRGGRGPWGCCATTVSTL